jgi:hypothetical protein
MHNSRRLDRRLLGSIPRADWDSIAGFVVSRLTDSVIEASVRRMPPAYYSLAGDTIATLLRLRRDGLQGFAGRFYERIAEDAEVHGTAEAESIHLAFEPDGSLRIRITCGTEESPGAAWLSRRFARSETRRVLLFLGGGKDRLTVAGTPGESIKVRVYDRDRRWIPEALARGRSRSGFQADP